MTSLGVQNMCKKRATETVEKTLVASGTFSTWVCSPQSRILPVDDSVGPVPFHYVLLNRKAEMLPWGPTHGKINWI